MTQKTNPLNLFLLYQHIRSMFFYHERGFGMIALLSVIIVLSGLSGIPLRQAPVIFVAGEVASKDVIADREIMIEDVEATRFRRNKIKALQPLVFDINQDRAIKAREDILALLHTLNTSIANEDQTSLDNMRKSFNKKYITNLDLDSFKHLAHPTAQEYAFTTLLPWLDKYLLAGVLPDMRLLGSSQNAIIIRNKAGVKESVRSIENGFVDIRALVVALGNKIRTDNVLNIKMQSAFIETFPMLLLPTLTLNHEASNARLKSILLAVEPVFYRINRGEIIVRMGDRVTRIAQLKMQALFESANTSFNLAKSIGVFFLGITFAIGLYMTPSGVKGRILKDKDQLFIAVILLLTGTAITFLSHYTYAVNSELDRSLFPYAFPIAGIAGLAVLIFSARRYCVFGLLLSFYAALLFDAGIGLFLFYFLSSMMSTWLILRTQSRQDVVWSTIPLFLWLFIVGFASAFLHGLLPDQYGNLAAFLVINSLFSILVLFALSPVLEMFFGYTTRFKLMELLSLDHPLLQELMMAVPGTYHHALVVSNLVESAAKAVGANSLLAKVGALYHDIGKIARPDYFAENQFDGINPHDKLSPAMSCLILFSHVKQGAELAQKYQLGAEITDMIQQHHGTRIPASFYHKAVSLGENPDKEDYRYPGPLPQTKEAAILMMADTVEAAIRAMGDPSPARIRTSVEMLIKNIYAEGQLDETDLTFKDLSKLIESFTRSLTGLNHQRIFYPESKKNNEVKSEDAHTSKLRDIESTSLLFADRTDNIPAHDDSNKNSNISSASNIANTSSDTSALNTASESSDSSDTGNSKENKE